MKRAPVLNPVFHQTLRTRIAALLSVRAYSFSELKSALGVTDGNLDAHLRKLSSAGYLHSRMVLTERPKTIYDLSPSGKRAFADYLVALKAIIKIASARTRVARR
jgi:DNA-binding MarR family transcriptional regulator